MTFDNQKTVEKLQALKKIYAILVLTSVIVLYTTKLGIYLHQKVGLSNPIISFSLVIAYLLYYFYHLFAKTSFLSFSDNDNRIVIRFYSLKSVNPKMNSIEIPKHLFLNMMMVKCWNLKPAAGLPTTNPNWGS